ncbi:MAG: TonB-dependent receptor [Paludibacter sp.]|nr:TonB-dependent receptor [Paludibacter sp.]
MKFQLHFLKLSWFFALLTLPLLSAQTIFAQKLVQIIGTVTFEDKEAVPGATVQIEGKKLSTVTDINGQFKISAPSDGTLVFSYVSMETQKLKIDNRTIINVVLKDNPKALDEVVVIGYGMSKKRDLTGSVGKADMSAILMTSPMSIGDALGGRIAGLNVISSDGAPGAESTVSIRGGSLSQDISPLFIIDGFPMENFSMNTLDPNTIESIDVLKDASSIAIYGSRGANGVVIITTKGVTEGQARLSYSSNFSLNTRPKFVDMMSSYDYVKLQLELESLTGGSTYIRDRYLGAPDENGLRPRDLEYYRNDPGTNWQEAITRNSGTLSHSFNLSGGNKETKYNVTLGYANQQGLVINTGMDRYSAKGIIDQKLSKDLKVNLSVNHTTTVTSSNNAFNQANQFFPTTGLLVVNDFLAEMEDMLNDGTLSTAGIDYGALISPLQQAQNEYDKRFQRQTLANIRLDYTFLKYFTFSPSFGLTLTGNKRDQFYNSKTRQGMVFEKPTGGLVNGNGINATRTINDVWSYLSENLLSYKRKFKNGHKLDALLGFTYQNSEWNPWWFTITNIPVAWEDLMFDRMDVGRVLNSQISSQRSGNRLASSLGRLNYSINDKYLFTVSAREDGSSKFAKGHQWGFFPSAAAAWRISDEKFMVPLKPFLSDAKIRASYGSVGNNRNVMDYAYVTEFSVGDALYQYMLDGKNLSYGALQFFYPNSELTWEKTKEFDLGLDLYMMNNRVNITMDYYHKITSNMLLARSVPTYLGYGNGANTRIENAGETQANGFELTINSVNIKKRNFVWTTNFNFSYVVSRINSFYAGYDNMTQIFNSCSPNQVWIGEVGKSTSQYYGFKYLGLYQESDFDQDANGQSILKPGMPTYKTFTGGYRLQPGDPKYADLNRDGFIDDNDRTTLGTPLPPITGGFSNDFKYKNWSLNLFFQFSVGNQLINFNKAVYETSGSYNRYANQYASYANHWTPENTNTDIPRLLKPNAKGDVNNTGAVKLSSRLIEDGSFLRFKNIALNYNLPKDWLKQLKIANVALNFSVQNLWVWTKYSGQDPEVNSYFAGVPKSFGYNTNSNSAPYTNLTGGLDNASYPRSRVYNFGVNITF